MTQPVNGYAFRRSVSQLRTYRTCGVKWLLQYSHGWSSVAQRGTYAFGDVVQAVAEAILTGKAPTADEAAALFTQLWVPFKDDKGRTWTSRASWALLAERGKQLVKLMALELPARVNCDLPMFLNQREEFVVDGVPMLGLPDFYGAVQRQQAGQWVESWAATVLDFKTSDRDYEDTAAELDEQLSLYQIAEMQRDRPVDQVGLCVLIYSAQPRIQWLLEPARVAEEIASVSHGVLQADRQIRAGEFARNERACHTMGACQFIPLCFPSQRGRIGAELKQQKKGDSAGIEAMDVWGDE